MLCSGSLLRPSEPIAAAPTDRCDHRRVSIDMLRDDNAVLWPLACKNLCSVQSHVVLCRGNLPRPFKNYLKNTSVTFWWKVRSWAFFVLDFLVLHDSVQTWPISAQTDFCCFDSIQLLLLQILLHAILG